MNNPPNTPISLLMTMSTMTKHLAVPLALGCIVFPSILAKKDS
jgi:hypothetical protein